MINLLLILSVMMQTSASVDADLDQIVRNVAENEQLYRSLDVQYRQETLTVLDPSKLKRRELLVQGRNFHLVTQGNLYRADMQEDYTYVDGTTKHLPTTIAYDGTTTRTNLQEVLGNIEDARTPTNMWWTPHRMAFPALPADLQCADWLGFTAAVSSRPAYRDMRVTTSILGKEPIDGIECYKVESTWKRTTEKVAATRLITWLAPSRNWMPLRQQSFHPSYTEQFPITDFLATDLRELRPGIWVPFKGTGVQNWTDDMAKNIETAHTQTTYTVDSIKLDPDYPVAYFRDVRMPVNAPIHTIKNGEIIHTEKILPPNPTGRVVSPSLLIVVGGLILSASAFLMFRARSRRSQASIDSSR